MRFFLNALSQLLAVTASAATFLSCLPSVGSHQAMLLVLALVSVVAVAVLWSSVLLLHSAHVRLTRGPGFVGWAAPRECTSLSSWLSYEWSFFSRTGHIEGMRVLGVEIAFAGALKG